MPKTDICQMMNLCRFFTANLTCIIVKSTAGYEPDCAPKFEAAVEEALKTSSPAPILNFDDNVIERAGECRLRSVMIMLGLVGQSSKIQIFSHEWSLGVGYCNALWRNNE